MAGDDAPPVLRLGTPRRAATAPMSPRQPPRGRRGSEAASDISALGSEVSGMLRGGGAVSASTTATNAAAASATEHSTVGETGSNVGVPTSGEAVETLYSHPHAKIISFTAGTRSALDGLLDGTAGASSSSRHSRGRSRRSMTAITEDDAEPGTLAWSSQFDRTLAVGALSIYRAPGSVAFLSCGAALQPILPKSQSWCIDEESSIFILQIRRPQYWRIEVPVDNPANIERAQRLRDVLDHILQFEKTPCPFKRSFVVDLPEQPATPLKKKPWTPVKLADNRGVASPSGTPTRLGRPQQPSQNHRVRSPSPTLSSLSVMSTGFLEESSSTYAPAEKQEHKREYTRREWLAMMESQKKNAAAAAVEHEVDEFGRRLVPQLVAEHEQRIMSVKASEIEVSKMGVPWHDKGGGSVVGTDEEPKRRRERSLSLSSDYSSTARQSAGGSSSAFDSLRSWFSAAATSPASSMSMRSRTGSGTNMPPGLAALFEDARRLLANNGLVANDPQPPLPPPPRIRHRATTSISTVSDHMPPAVNILTPYRHLQNGMMSDRATTRMEAMSRIPGSIINRILDILLAPPTYLLRLMLLIARRIVSGEWRGFASGTTDRGETIPVRWDYTDVDDPLGLSSGLDGSRNSSNGDLPRLRAMAQRRESRKQETSSVDRLRVYTEAHGDVYTDAEDDGDADDDDDDDEDTDHRSSALSKSMISAASDDHETLADAGGEPIVWTRRWAVD